MITVICLPLSLQRQAACFEARHTTHYTRRLIYPFWVVAYCMPRDDGWQNAVAASCSTVNTDDLLNSPRFTSRRDEIEEEMPGRAPWEITTASGRHAKDWYREAGGMRDVWCNELEAFLPLRYGGWCSSSSHWHSLLFSMIAACKVCRVKCLPLAAGRGGGRGGIPSKSNDDHHHHHTLMITPRWDDEDTIHTQCHSKKIYSSLDRLQNSIAARHVAEWMDWMRWWFLI